MTKVKAGLIAKAFLFWGIFELLVIAFRTIPLGIPKWSLGIVVGGVLTIVMILVSRLFLKYDNLTMSALGLTLAKGSYRRFFSSFVAGLAFVGCFFLGYLWLTPITVISVTDPNILDAALVSLFAMLMLSVMEEVVFRGYFLKKLESAVGIRIAIYVTSIAFGLYHGLTIDSLTGPAVWGLWYGVLALWSKGLAVPIGFHTGANFIQALFSQKENWASGFWTFDVADEATLFTVSQVTTGLQVFMLIVGVGLVEVYIRKVSSRP